jgi:hypothetical protein
MTKRLMEAKRKPPRRKHKKWWQQMHGDIGFQQHKFREASEDGKSVGCFPTSCWYVVQQTAEHQTVQ